MCIGGIAAEDHNRAVQSEHGKCPACDGNMVIDPTDTESEFAAYLEYQFISEIFKRLQDAQTQYFVLLKQHKFNVEYLATKEKIDHDLKELTPVVQRLGFDLIDIIQRKHNIKLKFVSREAVEGKSKILKP